MFQLSLIPLLLREIAGKRTLTREPEPESMNDPSSVAAYADSGRDEDGIMAVSNLFHAAHTTQVIQGCKKVLDLGCGPATQLVRIARLNPDTHFIGVDMAPEMVSNGRRYVESEGISNVTLEEGDITALKNFPDHSVDGVISTVTLHHLPELNDLYDCFSEIHRVLKPGGALYLSDFCRLKSIKSVHYFAYKYREQLPDVLCLDYEMSLRAAYHLDDFQTAMDKSGLDHATLYAMRFVPFMMVLKTADHPVSTTIKEGIHRMSMNLSRPYQDELNDMRRFFKMNGMEDTIFSK
ncbi:MAG: class I SAM-dependent methyltransferase [Sedimenticola sp.]